MRGRGEQPERTEIVMWLWSEQGPVRVVVPGQEPVFFLPQSHMAEAAELFKGAGVSGRFRRLPMHTFDGRAVVGCYFATLSAFHRAIELLLIRGLEHFEADIRLPERFLMERFITAGVRFEGRARKKGAAGLLGGERGALRAPGGDADPLLGVAGRGVRHGRGAFLGGAL
ncbi:hypothetical protein ACTG25_24565 [Aeromonas sp. 80P]